MNIKKILILILGVYLILLSSCTSRKKILYLRNSSTDSTTYYKSFTEEHKIVSGDVLYINFYSFNKPLSEIFNRQQGNNRTYSMWNSAANVYVNGFSVNDSGYVLLPMIGKIKIDNLTINQAKDEIQNKAKAYVSDVTVIVKLLNYRYTVIGEVTRPGTFTNYNDKLTIFQAIANAGEVTIYGNKTKTSIIRETKKGKIVIPVDFTDVNILASDIYYIKPNDIIYIEPIRFKSFKQNLPNIALLFSSITTTIIVLNFMSRQ